MHLRFIDKYHKYSAQAVSNSTLGRFHMRDDILEPVPILLGRHARILFEYP